MRIGRKIDIAFISAEQRLADHDSDVELMSSFLQAIQALPASAVARICGLDGQTIQNLRSGRIKRIRRNTRERIANYLSRHASAFIPGRSTTGGPGLR
ncbi:MAG: hypothetical protein WEE89_21345 [Gemmatimonadota bacterium]